MGLFNLFKRKSAGVAKGKRVPLIKRPPVFMTVNGKKVRVKNRVSGIDDRDMQSEYEDEGYDFALDANGVYDFDRDGDGYPGDPGGDSGGNDDIGMGNDDYDDDDIDVAGFDGDDDDDD